MAQRFAGEVAIVTGGSRGIGRAIAEALTREGATVAIALTRAIAIELAPYVIRVNAVCPGPVETDILLADVPTSEGRRELAAITPLGRLGRPEDVAGAVLYLASSDSDRCTGQAISIDGGLSILK